MRGCSMGNALSGDAVTALGNALAVNSSLRHLDLSYNHFAPRDIEVSRGR
jgi:hypothetical protein